MKEIFASELLDLYRLAEQVEDLQRYRILATKKVENLTFGVMLDALQTAKPEVYGTYEEATLRKKLNAKKPEKELLADLYQILKIEYDKYNITHEIASAEYIKNGKDSDSRGRISKARQEEKRRQYEQYYKQVKKFDIGYCAPIVYESLKSKTCYYKDKETGKSIECTQEIYEDLIQRDRREDLLKRILIIDEYFPELLEEFISRFLFSDEDEATMKKGRVEISYM